MNKQTDIERVTKKESLIKIAIAMHLKNYRVVRQIDHSQPQPAQKFRAGGIFWMAREAAGTGRASSGVLRGGLFWV